MATLNSDEVSALMSAIQDGRVSPEPSGPRANVVPYDLTSQDRVIRGQMPTLDAINEQVASMLGMGLAGRTRLSMRVTSAPATLLKFMDFNSMLAPPATVCVLSLGKGSGQAIVVLEPGLADALLAGALGDRKVRPEELPSDARRDFTSVERQVLKRLLTILTEAMRVAWAPVLPFYPEVLRFESDPRLAAIAPPNEAAILSSFEVTGAFNGRIQLAIPYSAVEPAKKALASPPRMASPGDVRFAAALAEEISRVSVELRSTLGRTHLTFERLLALEAGDVITLATSEGTPLPIFVEGRLKMMGQPRISGGALALVVTQGPCAEIRSDFEHQASKAGPAPRPAA
jgi:flagellar motor switch protein FliM